MISPKNFPGTKTSIFAIIYVGVCCCWWSRWIIAAKIGYLVFQTTHTPAVQQWFPFLLPLRYSALSPPFISFRENICLCLWVRIRVCAHVQPEAVVQAKLHFQSIWTGACSNVTSGSRLVLVHTTNHTHTQLTQTDVCMNFSYSLCFVSFFSSQLQKLDITIDMLFTIVEICNTNHRTKQKQWD